MKRTLCTSNTVRQFFHSSPNHLTYNILYVQFYNFAILQLTDIIVIYIIIYKINIPYWYRNRGVIIIEVFHAKSDMYRSTMSDSAQSAPKPNSTCDESFDSLSRKNSVCQASTLYFIREGRYG